jgi:hypothetical protein
MNPEESKKFHFILNLVYKFERYNQQTRAVSFYVLGLPL